MEVVNVKLDEQNVNAIAPDVKEKHSKETLELESLKKEMKDKVYAFDVTDDSFKYLKDFIENKAEWNFTEALGVVELYESLNRSSIKGGQIFLKNIEVEAIYYFLKKHTAKGYNEASSYKALLKPLNDAFVSVRNDNTKVLYKEQRVASLDLGMDPDVEGSDLKNTEETPVTETP
jgi:hypothetical protein